MNPQPLTLDAIRAHATSIEQPADGVEVYHVIYDIRKSDAEQLRHMAFTPQIATAPGITFTHVATVPSSTIGTLAADLKAAFYRTQNIEHYWYEDVTLQDVAPGNHRSTSVGDVLLRRSTGALYVVLPQGYGRL